MAKRKLEKALVKSIGKVVGQPVQAAIDDAALGNVTEVSVDKPVIIVTEETVRHVTIVTEPLPEVIGDAAGAGNYSC